MPISCYQGLEPPCWRTGLGPPPIKARPGRANPDAALAMLPGEVLDAILEMLKELHPGGQSDSCATCWMRDLCSLSLCSRSCARAAGRAL